METGTYILREEKRKQASKEVKIQFVDAENNFNVIDDEGNLKYCGKLIGQTPNIDDDCTCPSFYHGNVKLYVDEHGYAFQCKHLIKARELRFTNYPIPVTNDCVSFHHISRTHEVAP